MMRIAVCLTLLVCTTASSKDVASSRVTPMEKVIKLIKDLRKEVQVEGAKEAATYAKFACFCKAETKKTSKSINARNKKITELSANHAKQSANKAAEQADNSKKNNRGEELAATLASDVSACKVDKAKYEATAADQNKAIASLKSAVKSMTASKPKLIQLSALDTSVRAAVMERTGVDPNSADFAYHSKDIIDMCDSLLKDFKGKKSQLDKDWKSRDTSCKALKKASEDSIAVNDKEISKNNKQIEVINQKLALYKKGLTEEQSGLQDDELLLKDLTASCEARAKDWDQRTGARAGEIKALSAALSALTGEGKGTGYVSASAAAGKVNKRAALVAVKAHEDGDSDEDDSDKDEADKDDSDKDVSEKDQSDKDESSDDEEESASKAPSLLQTMISGSLSPERRAQRSLAMLQVASRKLGSLTLSSLVVRARGSPFKKLQKLMSDLMQGLIEEAAAEATKKGFCDTEMGKVENTEAARWEEVSSISVKIQGLETKKDELVAEIAKLGTEIKDANDALSEATKNRHDEHEENTEALATAKAGLDATQEAMDTLKNYYSEAAKGAALLQASPLDGMKGSDAGFEGSYKGAQGSMDAVIGLLETIQSDFERTIRNTEASEESGHSDYQELSTGLKVDISGKSTSKEYAEQDLKSTRATLKEQYDDMKTNMDLLDDAFKEHEDLIPTCVDTGMSYKERVQKRDQEIAALKQAYKQLSPK